MTDENQHPYVYAVVIKYFGPQQCHVYQEATFHIYAYDLSLLYCIIADKANMIYLWNPHDHCNCIPELGNDYNYEHKHIYHVSIHIWTYSVETGVLYQYGPERVPSHVNINGYNGQLQIKQLPWNI